MRYSLLIFIVFLLSCSPKEEFFIASGSPGAIYYPTAKALCKNFNRFDKQYKCKPLISKGSEKNLQDLKNGEVDFGISQITLQNEYYNNRKAKNLRSVMGLHHEHFSIIANKDSNITTFNDLKGKRVNIGNPGSGSRIYFERIMRLKGWKLTDFAEIYEERSSGLDNLLCGNKIDAAIYLVGHPNKIFNKIINKCNGKLVSLSKKEQKALKKVLPNFKNTSISVNTYKKQNYNVSTLGVPIILSAHSNTKKDVVSKLLKYSKKNKDFLETENVIFKEMKFELPQGRKAPLYIKKHKLY